MKNWNRRCPAFPIAKFAKWKDAEYGAPEANLHPLPQEYDLKSTEGASRKWLYSRRNTQVGSGSGNKPVGM